MPAYLVAVCQVTDPNENFKKYAFESAKLMHEHGGEYLVRGPAAEVHKGDVLKGKVVIDQRISQHGCIAGLRQRQKIYQRNFTAAGRHRHLRLLPVMKPLPRNAGDLKRTPCFKPAIPDRQS